jgi:hypothetical protein
VLVKTLDPGMAGMAHDATGLGDRSTYSSARRFKLDLQLGLTSTRHIRQLPAMARRSW